MSNTEECITDLDRLYLVSMEDRDAGFGSSLHTIALIRELGARGMTRDDILKLLDKVSSLSSEGEE